MNNLSNTRTHRIERRSLFFVTLVLCLGFFTLHNNNKKQFQTAEAGYMDNSTLHLNMDIDADDLSGLLLNGNYIFDEKDARFIAYHLKKNLNDGKMLPNLGELNKSAFRIPALLADSLGGAGLKMRVDSSLLTLGITSDAIAMYSQPPANAFSLNNGDGTIKVMVQETDTTLHGWDKYLQRALNRDKKAMAGVLVRLKEHYYIYADAKKEKITEVKDSIAGYAFTDSTGMAVFAGLDENGYYSVLPVKKGFEYGSPKGTAQGALRTLKESRRTFEFLQREHKITPFDMQTYLQIKEDNVLTVRTPSQFRSNMIAWLIAFFMVWWGLSFFLHRQDKKPGRKAPDPLLLPILMMLSGIGVLMMYSVTNPLSDKLLGNDMAAGAVAGAILIGVISQIDFALFFGSRYQWFGWFRSKNKIQTHSFIQFDFVMQWLNWLAKPFPEKIRSTGVTKEQLGNYRLRLLFAVLFFPVEIVLRPILWITKPFPEKIRHKNLTSKNLVLYRIKLILAVLFRPVEWLTRPVRLLFTVEGVGYLLIAFLLIALLELFGDGPEGSGVKVNLFFFQPSEITKYLIILFLSAFFKNNAEKIRKFSGQFDWKHFKAQSATVAKALLGIGILLGCYLVLGDMGPALVLAVTFIITYSVVRRDIWHLLAGVVSFVGLLLFGRQLDNSPLTLEAFSILWLFLWILYGIAKKRLYESAIFMNLVIAAFIYGSSLLGSAGLSHQAQRLQDRSDICLNGVWDNEVRGGDQVVQGLWSLSSGGINGQGLGEGNPNLTPAFHTDMIFTSIGEVMGWIGLLLIVLCMAILIHRSLHTGYKAGNPFLFFLSTGIAVVTGVQFLVITLGSVGLIPLTGVAVPFLSFGKTSLIINLMAFGILFSISKKPATEMQVNSIKPYSRVIGVSSFAYWSISVILLAFLLWHQWWKQDETLVRPAFVVNQQGERVVEYNPRIRLLIKKMEAGNIYDRNGTVLATNDKNLIRQQIDGNRFDGVDESIYTKELQLHKQRYYPFGENLFFWLGDYNTKVFWNDSENDPRGYIAERRHLAGLRGFDNLKDNNGNLITKGIVVAKRYKGSPFLYPVKKEYPYIKYNYSALLPLLKDGLNGSQLAKWNKKRNDRDITLTVDAALQTKIQNEIRSYAEENFRGPAWNKLRISAVIINAQTGDLLCSANYPLPDQDTLRYKPNYSDRYLKEKAYTDRDLGLTFQTAPGSTAKVMSALAGLQQMDVQAAEEKYFIYHEEIIERGKVEEPHSYTVSMENAIVISSNCYFINLVNDHNLYTQLDSIYSTVGIRIDQKLTGKRYLTPYYFSYDSPPVEYKNEIAAVGEKAVQLYDDYITNRDTEKIVERMSGYARNSRHDWNDCAWAWGQGTLRATPLNMARVASIVANDGTFVPTQFIFAGNKDNTVTRPDYRSIPIVSEEAAGILKQYMIKESDKHRNDRNNPIAFPAGLNMGGKTGTPERGLYVLEHGKWAKVVNKSGSSPNDGWYIFFIDSEKEQAPLAVAVRMERLFDSGSKTAVRLADKVVVKVLGEEGYVD